MRANNVVVGMMDPAYFVGRKQILDWLNDICCLNLTKIEETANGAVCAQVLDCLFPGTVPMHKLNWGASSDYDVIANYKVLQNVFIQLDIDKQIEVDKLIRARYQDNLEFMQWLRRFYEINSTTIDNQSEFYDAVARRNKGKDVNKFKPAQGKQSPGEKKLKNASTGIASKVTVAKNTSKPPSPPKLKASSTISSTASTSAVTPEKVSARQKTLIAENRATEVADAHDSIVSNFETEKAKFIKQMNDMREDIVALEKERDFYFNKLREVEIFIQGKDFGNFSESRDDLRLARKILTILYKSDEDEDSLQASRAAEMALESAKEARSGVSEKNNKEGQKESMEGGHFDKTDLSVSASNTDFFKDITNFETDVEIDLLG